MHFNPYVEPNAPLKFTSTNGQTISLDVTNYSLDESLHSYHPNLEISFDGSNWTIWNGEEKDSTDDTWYYSFDILSFEEHPTIYVRGNNPERFSDKSNASNTEIYCTFKFGSEDISVSCEGNVMSLLGENITEIPCNGCFASLFCDYCTSLTTAPALPATMLTDCCYQEMFYNCTSLTTAPALPATTLADWCYYLMFDQCTSLTIAPALPATTLAESCYYQMFYNCTSLTTAPALPAPTLADWCYYYMFYNCTNLKSITMLATDISANSCLSNWVRNVAATGTFKCAPGMSDIIPIGVNGIPSGWTAVEI